MRSFARIVSVVALAVFAPAIAFAQASITGTASYSLGPSMRETYHRTGGTAGGDGRSSAGDHPTAPDAGRPSSRRHPARMRSSG